MRAGRHGERKSQDALIWCLCLPPLLPLVSVLVFAITISLVREEAGH